MPDSRSGRSFSFDSKLISLLPLDEAPVHVPLRRPRPLRFERLPVPVWNPYSRDRLGPAKSEDRKGGEGKTDANLTHFFSTCRARQTSSPATRPGASPPQPQYAPIPHLNRAPLRPLGAPSVYDSESFAGPCAL